MNKEAILGFGAIKRCQEAIGIPCENCRYYIACMSSEEGELK